MLHELLEKLRRSICGYIKWWISHPAKKNLVVVKFQLWTCVTKGQNTHWLSKKLLYCMHHPSYIPCSTWCASQRHSLLRFGLGGVYGRSIRVSGLFEVLLDLSVENVFVETFATGTTTAGCGVAVATAARTVRSCEQRVVEKR